MSDPEELTLRLATVADVDPVAALHADRIAEGFLVTLGPAFLRRLYRRIVLSEGAFVFVAGSPGATGAPGQICGFIAVAEREFKQAEERFAKVQKDAPMLKEEVDEEDIAKLVSKWTGIPTGRLLEGEAQKLVKMEARLRDRVVGQDDALARVSNAVRRTPSRAPRRCPPPAPSACGRPCGRRARGSAARRGPRRAAGRRRR